MSLVENILRRLGYIKAEALLSVLPQGDFDTTALPLNADPLAHLSDRDPPRDMTKPPPTPVGSSAALPQVAAPVDERVGGAVADDEDEEWEWAIARARACALADDDG